MVELVDTQDLESCEETRTGSIPAIRTKKLKFPHSIRLDWGFIFSNPIFDLPTSKTKVGLLCTIDL